MTPVLNKPYSSPKYAYYFCYGRRAVRACGCRGCYTWSCKHVGVAEVIAAVLQRFSHTHVFCYMEVWGAEIGPAAAGPAGSARTAL